MWEWDVIIVIVEGKSKLIILENEVNNWVLLVINKV